MVAIKVLLIVLLSIRIFLESIGILLSIGECNLIQTVVNVFATVFDICLIVFICSYHS